MSSHKKVENVPLDLLEALEAMYPDKTLPTESHGEVMYHSGERAVIRYLRQTYERENTRNNNVLSQRIGSRSRTTTDPSP